jgi:hypothetical protein
MIPPADAGALQELIDYTAIRRLQDAYADIVTRRVWPELHDIFLPGVRLTLDLRTGEPRHIDGAAAIGDFIGTAIDRFEFFEFVILNSRVYLRDEGDENSAVARLFMNEIRQERSNGQWSMVYGVYHDRFRRIDGRWWFAARQYHSLARSARGLETFALPDGRLFPTG